LFDEAVGMLCASTHPHGTARVLQEGRHLDAGPDAK